MSDISGIIDTWALLISPLSKTEREEIYQEDKFHEDEVIPVFLIGCVYADYKRRFKTGSTFRSSILKGFDLQNMTVYTDNSIYQLKGPGEIRYEYPPLYPDEIAEAVGKTIVRLEGFKSMSLIDENYLKTLH
jgi:hypothetical protein